MFVDIFLLLLIGLSNDPATKRTPFVVELHISIEHTNLDFLQYKTRAFFSSAVPRAHTKMTVTSSSSVNLLNGY